MSGVISDNTVRSSGAVAPLSSSTLDASNPAIDTNPTDGVGTKWINTTSGQIFICIDATTNSNQWIGQTTTSITPRVFSAGGRAGTEHASIGEISTLEYINPGTLSDAIDFGDLLYVNQYWTGTSNGTNDRGISAGGTDPSSPSDVIQYVTCSTLGNATDFGNLIAGTVQAGAASNGTNDRGVWAGGEMGGGALDNVQTTEYVTISTTGNSTNFGNLTTHQKAGNATSNGTNERGIVMGGTYSGYLNTITYFTINSPGNSTDFGDLTQARGYCSALSNGTGERGICCWGIDSSAPYFDIYDYVTISSTGNATDFGDGTIETQSPASTSNGFL